MEMPDVIYADLDLGSEDPETPYFAGEYKDGEPVSGKYHHDRIKEQDDATIESLRRENEALHIEIDDCHKRLNRWADAHSELIGEVDLRKENDELKAKLEANKKLMNESADKLIKANAEIMQAFEIMKAKLDKAKWQPIETAPRDGSRFLVYSHANDYGAVQIGYWYDGGLHGCGHIANAMATHWMPLPDAPEQP